MELGEHNEYYLGDGVSVSPYTWASMNNDMEFKDKPWRTYRGDKPVSGQVTYKVDGVQGRWTGDSWVSKSGKPLYNIDDPKYKEVCCYELFAGSWEDTVAIVRAKNSEDDVGRITIDMMYDLEDPCSDLWVTAKEQMTPEEVKEYFDVAIEKGYEGLVIEDLYCIYKVKPVETFDVPVIAIHEGTGKNIGKVGALETPKGKVGVGLTDKQRQELYSMPIGTIIEVECMSITPAGKFRHPRFIRVREDK